MEPEEEAARRAVAGRPHLRRIGLIIALVGCASAPPARVDLRTGPPSPDPLAFSYFVAAKGAELRGDHARAAAALTRAVQIDSTSATLYRLLARNLAALNRHAEALAPAHQAAHLNPGNLDNRWTLYNALLAGTRDTLRALAELDEIAVRSPNPIRALDTSLRIHTQRQNREGVIAVLDRIVVLPDLDDRGRLIAAQNYRRNGHPAKAEALLRDVLRRQPHLGEAWIQLGGVVGSRGDTLGAARAYRRGVTRVSGEQAGKVWRQIVSIYLRPNAFQALLAESPFDAPFAEGLADVFRSFGRGSKDVRQGSALYNQALALLDHLAGLFPGRADLHAKVGELHLNLNQGKNAREAFKRASSIDGSPEYSLGYAHALILDREFQPAIGVLESILAATEDSTETRSQIVFTLGNAYSAIGQNDKARGVFQAALDREPDHTGFAFERAQTLMRDQDWDGATRAFETLLPKVESNASLLMRTLYGLARANERADRFQTAVRLFERLIAINPDHDEALNYLGYMFAERGIRLGEAQQFIQRALEKDPENGAYLDSMGWVYYQMGVLERAREYLQKAIHVEEDALQNLADTDPRHLDSMHENLAVIHEHAGDVEAALEQKDRARAHWSRARSYDPDNEALVKKLGELEAPQTERDTP